MKHPPTFVKEVLIRQYYLAKAAFFAWRFLKVIRTDPIIIYQMGKVGSTTILYSMQNSALRNPIFQVHALTKIGLERIERKYWGARARLFRPSLLPETEHIYNGHFLRFYIKQLSKKPKYITLLRDPIARNVSEFFYSFDTRKANPYLPEFHSYQDQLTLTDLYERFLDCFSLDSEEVQSQSEWFDEEFFRFVGIDIYSYVFPKDKGFQIISTESADVLILKLEKLNQCAKEAFSSFLGIEDFNLVTANKSSQKQYAAIYKEFVNHARLPEAYIKGMYDTKLVRHFYSEEEIDIFTSKWGDENAC